jgi:hypothetical protein
MVQVTTSQDLINRVRSNIYERIFTAGQELRTDEEIMQWLTDSLYTYIADMPADAFPELLVESAVVSWPWTIPAEFSKLIEVVVTHTVAAASYTEPAYVLKGDESYIRLRLTNGIGAWAQMRSIAGSDVVDAGPAPTAGIVKYIKTPQNLKNPNANLDLDAEHEEPIVNRATALALAKINDAESAFFMDLYKQRIAAEHQRHVSIGGLVAQP